MKHRYLGETGLRVSRLGLGTLTWGLLTDEHEAGEQLDAFLDAGGSLVDTGPAFDGAAETTLAKLVSGAVSRDDLVLCSRAGAAGNAGATPDVSRRGLLHALDASLGRLGVDHVDLWQVDAWSDRVPVEETMSALDAAVASGRTRYVGVANYTAWQAAMAATHQRSVPGRYRLAAAQAEYSLLTRAVEPELVPAAESLGLGLLAWAPLGRGALTGKYRDGIPSDSRAASSQFQRYVEQRLTPRSERIVEAVTRAADGLDLSPALVALAWVRDQPCVTAPVVGARTADQLRQLLPVEDVTLPAQIAEALDDVSAPAATATPSA